MPEPSLRLSFLDKGVAQIAFIVPDLEAAVENYHEMFGISDWHFYTYAKPMVSKMSYRGRPADYRMRVALSYFGPMRVELIQMLDGDTIYAEFVRDHGYGVQHLGVLVDDMDAALAEAEAAGVDMIMDGSGFGLDGDGHYAYLDTEKRIGITIELIERPKGRRTPEKILYPAVVS
jgi:catechol 2,3-dioxygenase-like lactoylglutathione lyase family enzyme